MARPASTYRCARRNAAKILRKTYAKPYKRVSYYQEDVPKAHAANTHQR